MSLFNVFLSVYTEMLSVEATITNAVREAGKSLGFEMGGEISLEIPHDENHGDLATNVAMRLASRLKRSPLSVAQELANEIQERLAGKTVSKIEAKPPGFINFFLHPETLYGAIHLILKERERYGAGRMGNDEPVLLEFVSANPTGALSVAHGRQGAVGDSLSRVLRFVGYRPECEYYLNDVGNQMNLLAQSIYVRYRELLNEKMSLPEGGYKGRYLIEIAKKFKEEAEKVEGKDWNPQTCEVFRRFGMERILEGIREDLEHFGVHFDRWFSQEELERSGKVKEMMDRLKKEGWVYEREGALWFKSSAFGDDKDRVVVKSGGSFTYLAPDMAYHHDKLLRGYKKLINLWGPDHHGYILRMKAAVRALGYSTDSLVVLIVQLTTLYEGERQLKMSTREGEFITLREVIEAVGKDAARFFFLMRKVDSHLDFDLELAKKQSAENPVYYIQYAHARICSIMEFARESGIRTADAGGVNFQRLQTEEEIKLMKVLRQFPMVVRMCAQRYEPYYLIPHLQRLAESFHQFYHRNRVISDDSVLSQARLALIDCVRIVIASGLGLLGVSTPEKM